MLSHLFTTSLAKPIIQVLCIWLENFGAGGLVNDAIGAISKHIRENDLMPGDRLPSEASMSKELNLSRTVVLEAFR
jgi:GntR family transcriptional regulator, transcriptional repressor for pyruvate dehydrogenase complex